MREEEGGKGKGETVEGGVTQCRTIPAVLRIRYTMPGTDGVLSYAFAMRCPVLIQRMLLPGGFVGA
eukprot:1850891-Rhodomonas_salina.2